jgi:hypothetical protein
MAPPGSGNAGVGAPAFVPSCAERSEVMSPAEQVAHLGERKHQRRPCYCCPDHGVGGRSALAARSAHLHGPGSTPEEDVQGDHRPRGCADGLG